jgi:hypothetical protein
LALVLFTLALVLFTLALVLFTLALALVRFALALALVLFALALALVLFTLAPALVLFTLAPVLFALSPVLFTLFLVLFTLFLVLLTLARVLFDMVLFALAPALSPSKVSTAALATSPPVLPAWAPSRAKGLLVLQLTFPLDQTFCFGENEQSSSSGGDTPSKSSWKGPAATRRRDEVLLDETLRDRLRRPRRLLRPRDVLPELGRPRSAPLTSSTPTSTPL